MIVLLARVPRASNGRPRTPWPPPAAAGFTLLEMLLALGIFALVSAMAYTGLRSVLEAGAAVRFQAARLAALQLAFGRLGMDFEQAAPRPIRDAFGDVQAAMRGGEGTGLLVEFTRGGVPNPTQRRRAGLQRVGYAVRGGALVRLIWPVLDRADDRPPAEHVLLQEVQSVRLRFQDAAQAWLPVWPPPGGDPKQTFARLPVAVEVSVTIDQVGEVTRLFAVTG